MYMDGTLESPCPLLPVPQITLTHHLQFSMTHLYQIKLIPKKYWISYSCTNFANTIQKYFIRGQAWMVSGVLKSWFFQCDLIQAYLGQTSSVMVLPGLWVILTCAAMPASLHTSLMYALKLGLLTCGICILYWLCCMNKNQIEVPYPFLLVRVLWYLLVYSFAWSSEIIQ